MGQFRLKIGMPRGSGFGVRARSLDLWLMCTTHTSTARAPADVRSTLLVSLSRPMVSSRHQIELIPGATLLSLRLLGSCHAIR